MVDDLWHVCTFEAPQPPTIPMTSAYRSDQHAVVKPTFPLRCDLVASNPKRPGDAACDSSHLPAFVASIAWLQGREAGGSRLLVWSAPFHRGNPMGNANIVTAATGQPHRSLPYMCFGASMGAWKVLLTSGLPHKVIDSTFWSAVKTSVLFRHFHFGRIGCADLEQGLSASRVANKVRPGETE